MCGFMIGHGPAVSWLGMEWLAIDEMIKRVGSDIGSYKLRIGMVGFLFGHGMGGFLVRDGTDCPRLGMWWLAIDEKLIEGSLP